MLFLLSLAVGPTVQAESGLGSSQSGGLTSDVLQSLGFISPSGKLTQLQRMRTAETGLHHCSSVLAAGWLAVLISPHGTGQLGEQALFLWYQEKEQDLCKAAGNCFQMQEQNCT